MTNPTERSMAQKGMDAMDLSGDGQPVSARMEGLVLWHRGSFYFQDGSSIEPHENSVARVATPAGTYSEAQIQKLQSMSNDDDGLSIMGRLKRLLGDQEEATRPKSHRPG